MKRILILSMLSVIVLIRCLGGVVLRGTVSDSMTGERLAFATVRVAGSNQATHADADGVWSMTVPDGQCRVTASYIGYESLTVTAAPGKAIALRLKPAATLGEVVVTAREGRGLTSTSFIDRDAMTHLQPTSFTDILELLPGNISHDPDMSSANSITLRETGAVTATGARTSTADDYAITSLGTRFMIDGAPIDGDANLQSVPSGDASDPSAKRSSVNRGVDMRTIPTDNIESVEIVRGIPSAEYGNLTSGLVNIKRMNRATPWTGRFKADEYGKLFSLGKGFAFGNHHLNLDGGFLDSKIDPRDNLESYKRINASARATLQWHSQRTGVRWNIAADYTGSFDDAKIDPDLNFNKIDRLESSYNRYSFTSSVALNFNRLKWLTSVDANVAASYQLDRLTRDKQVAPQRASIAPTTMEEGVHDGRYLLSEYMAHFISDGRPLSAFVKLRAQGEISTGTVNHVYKAGTEWSVAKNYGRGQIYDLERPLSASWTTRPRRFSDIPALHLLSFFAEENATLLLGSSKAELQLGARTSQIPSLNRLYTLSGKVYVDPRLNAVFTFPGFKAGGHDMKWFIGGGWGVTTKMPTVDYLYPQVHYNDLVQLNYYDIIDPMNRSKVSLRTYVNDAVNYDLHAARNGKWEVRVGCDWADNRLSVTCFAEHLTSGFRYSRVYAPYGYRSYDASGVDASQLTSPPDLAALPYKDVQILDGMSRVTNGTRIDKRGVEFQLNTARWRPLMTSLTVTGAWFSTRYSNSQRLFVPVNDVVGDVAVSDRYVGLYDSDDGRINEQFNTNFIFDTQIPRWGLVFTTTFQFLWWVKTTRMRENGVPDMYLSATDGELHPYTADAAGDVMLQYLVRHFNDASFLTLKVPVAMYLNLKATKKIGKWLKVSAFVNRIMDYLPDYTSNGLTVRRISEAYFGMELNFTL